MCAHAFVYFCACICYTLARELSICLYYILSYVCAVTERVQSSLHGSTGESFRGGQIPTREWSQSESPNRGMCLLKLAILIVILSEVV